MPYIRKLPSGLWQATVRGPDGRRHTQTDRLKSVVNKWAIEQEAAFARGDRRDPRAGQIRIGEWRDRVMGSRRLEAPTLAKGASIWRTHCESKWARWPMAAVTRAEAQEWANDLTATRRARHKGRKVQQDDADVPLLKPSTVHECANTMSTLYGLAMRESPPLVTINPFEGLDLPRIEPRPVEFYEPDEADRLFAAVEKTAGTQWRIAVELGMHVGLRPGELFGLHARRVSRRRCIEIVEVMTRYGLRGYPKSRKSHRTVRTPDPVFDGLLGLLHDRDVWADCTCPKARPDGTRQPGDGPCPALVFPAPEGGPIDDGRFRDRVWNPAVEAADIRRFPPKIMRHTAASWLVQDGVPLYDVQALLGHEDFRTTQRYAHLAPDRHDRVAASWERRTKEA